MIAWSPATVWVVTPAVPVIDREPVKILPSAPCRPLKVTEEGPAIEPPNVSVAVPPRLSVIG